VKRTSQALKTNIALPHRGKWKKLTNLGKAFTERLRHFSPSGKEQSFALENIFKESSLMWYSVVPSQQKTHPATVICISMERKYSSFIYYLKCRMKVNFPQTTAKPRKILFKIHNLTYSGGYFISKRLRFMYIGCRCDRCYLCLPTKWRIFGKFVELCTARSGECPQISFYRFLDRC